MTQQRTLWLSIAAFVFTAFAAGQVVAQVVANPPPACQSSQPPTGGEAGRLAVRISGERWSRCRFMSGKEFSRAILLTRSPVGVCRVRVGAYFDEHAAGLHLGVLPSPWDRADRSLEYAWVGPSPCPSAQPDEPHPGEAWVRIDPAIRDRAFMQVRSYLGRTGSLPSGARAGAGSRWPEISISVGRGPLDLWSVYKIQVEQTPLSGRWQAHTILDVFGRLWPLGVKQREVIY